MEKLGINVGFLLAQILNFGIVVIALGAAWRPLVKMLEARRARIAKGLEDAHEAELKLANAERDAQKLLDQRRIEGNKLVEEARGRADEAAKVVVDEARKEADAIRAKGRQEAEEEKVAILGQMRSQVAEIAIAAAERVVGDGLLDKARAAKVVTNFFTALPAEAKALGANIEVTSALPLTDAEQAQVKSQTGATNVSFKVDPSVLGGLVLRAGDKVVDGSVRSGLHSLAASIS